VRVVAPQRRIGSLRVAENWRARFTACIAVETAAFIRVSSRRFEKTGTAAVAITAAIASMASSSGRVCPAAGGIARFMLRG